MIRAVGRMEAGGDVETYSLDHWTRVAAFAIAHKSVTPKYDRAYQQAYECDVLSRKQISFALAREEHCCFF